MDIFICVGIYRVLFKYVEWKNWQIILTKISLIAAMIVHIDLAAKFILDPNTPETLKEFIFIYVFGYFSLYYEFVAKFTDIDGTGNLKTSYQPVGGESEKENHEHSREVVNFEESNGSRMGMESMQARGND